MRIAAIAVLAAMMPMMAHAAVGAAFKDLVESFGRTISTQVMPLLVALAVLAFFYNIIFFILRLDNEKERIQFRQYTINALVVLTIMLTMWGVIGLATNTFFQGNPVIPQFPTSD